MVSIEMTSPKWINALSTWSTYSGEPLLQVLRDETRGVIERAVKFTPPQRGEKQGRRAVETDIRKLFKTEAKSFKTGTFDKNKVQSGKKGNKTWVNKYPRNIGGRFHTLLRGNTGWAGSPARTSMILNKIGKNIGMPKIRLAGGTTIYKEHEKHRTGKWRRVKGRGGSEIVITPEAVLSDYISGRQKKVGLHRAGWAVAGKALGMSFADYVSRNASQRVGRYKEHSAGRLLGCEVGNKAPGIVEQDNESRILGQAVAARTRDIENRLKNAIAGTLDSIQTPGRRFTGRMVGSNQR